MLWAGSAVLLPVMGTGAGSLLGPRGGRTALPPAARRQSRGGDGSCQKPRSAAGRARVL